MSSELNASIRLNLTGNLTEKSRAYQREMKGMARQTRLSFQIMNQASKQAMRGINSGLDSMTSSYAAFAASLAGGVSFRNAVSLERRMNRIGVQAEISTEKVKKLRDEIYDTSMQPNIAINPGEMISAIEEIVTRTGDLDYARQNIEALGQAIQATGAMGSDIGGLVAELKKLEVTDVSRGLNILIAQGKAGAVEAKDLATLGPRILSAYAATGRTGEGAITELGAAMQVLNMATGSPDVAATTLEALLRDLQSPDKQRKLMMSGVSLYEENEDGIKVLRDLPSIMTDITKKFDGNMSRIGLIFGDEARRGFNNIAAEMLKTGKVTAFEQFANLDIDFTRMKQDAATIASDATGGLQRLSTSWNDFINNQLDEPLNDLADTLSSVNKETVQSIYNIGKWGAAIGGSVLLLRKIGAFKGAAWLYRTIRNRRSNNGMDAAAGMGAMSVQPVYVVNMPGSGFGGSGMGRGGRTTPRLGTSSPYLLGGPDAIDADFDEVPSRRRGRWSRMRNSRFGRFGRRLAGPGGGRLLGVAGSGLMLADVAMNGGDASDIGAAAGSGLGGWGGAQLGAAIGTAIVPGLGTAIGGVLGGLIGSIAGSYAGEAAGEAYEGRSSQEVRGEVIVSVEDNRVTTKQVTSNSPNFNFSAGAGSDPGYWGGF